MEKTKQQPSTKTQISLSARFFIWCANATPQFLRECPQSEVNKYVSIGATVFFTGIFAFIASSYAFYRVFVNQGSTGIGLSIAFGVLWGLMIFNLDRYIVSSLRKEDKFWKEFGMALPRLLIAGLISIVIAKPLEVRLFQDRIAHEIMEFKQDNREASKLRALEFHDTEKLALATEAASTAVAAKEVALLGEPTDPDYTDLKQRQKAAKKAYDDMYPIKKAEKNKVQAEINTIWANRDSYNYTYDDDGREIDKRYKPAARARMNELIGQRKNIDMQLDFAERQYVGLGNELDLMLKEYRTNTKEQIAALKDKQKQAEKAKSDADQKVKEDEEAAKAVLDRSHSENFITQLEALHRLTTKNDTMWYISMLLALLFFVIETAPVFVKLMTSRGPYDEYVDSAEHKSKEESNLRKEVNRMEMKHHLEKMREIEFKSQLEQLQMDNHLNRFTMIINKFGGKRNEVEKELQKMEIALHQMPDSEAKAKFAEIIDQMRLQFYDQVATLATEDRYSYN